MINNEARLPEPGDLVVAAGIGVTGVPVVRYLVGLGARVVATSQRPPPPEFAEIADAADAANSADSAAQVSFAGDLRQVPEGTTVVVTSAGIPPHHPLLASAVDAGVEVIGEAELAWRIDHAPGAEPRPWLVVTGTNGKTTTIGMLEAILRADGREVTACGNVGWPVLDAVLAGRRARVRDGSAADDPAGRSAGVRDGSAADDPAGQGGRAGFEPSVRQDVIAAELSSFQLHYAPSIRPTAGVVLNLAEDHLDWHGSMAAYAAAKAIALAGDTAVAVVSDPGAAGLLADSPAPRKIGVIPEVPADGQIGIIDGRVTDLALGHGEIFGAGVVRLPGAHNLTNAMAAAALGLAVDVRPGAISEALDSFGPAAHRNQSVATVGGVEFVNDTKATNPHAAAASLLAYDRVVWIAGGQLKGASVDELVAAVAGRLAGVVLLGVDAPVIEAALARHAPDVPRISVDSTDDGAMDSAVRAATSMAAPGTTVLLAPAAASLDMFASYAARGDAFTAAVRNLGAATTDPDHRDRS